MKITCKQNIPAAIAAGIEPASDLTVDIDLSTLTPEQRAELAGIVSRGWQPELVALTPDSLRDHLQSRIDTTAKAAADKAAADAEDNQLLLKWMSIAKIEKVTTQSECGVSWDVWRVVPSKPYTWGKPSGADASALLDRLAAEAEAATAASKAAVQPQIDAAAAKIRADAEAAELAKKAAEAAKFAKRLETGIVTVEIQRGSRQDWGEPWIATVKSGNGRRPEYDFSAGSYDAANGVLSIPCKPGDIIAYGQKNYKKAKRTIHETKIMGLDGGLKDA